MSNPYKPGSYWDKLRKIRLEATKEQRAKICQYNKERRIFLKERGICTRCGQNDILPGLTFCSACQEKMRRKRKPVVLTEAQKERNARLMKLRYERLKASGVCVICGKEPAEPGLVRCRNCRLFHNQSNAGHFQHSIKWSARERKAGRL